MKFKDFFVGFRVNYYPVFIFFYIFHIFVSFRMSKLLLWI